MKRVLCLLAGCWLALSACSRTQEELQVNAPWVRLNPPGSQMTAAYGTLHNAGTEALTLNRITSAEFADISLHQTVDVDGKARMRSVKSLTLGPDETLNMAPGGYHLMLMQPRTELDENATVELTFEFASGYQAVILFNVRRP